MTLWGHCQDGDRAIRLSVVPAIFRTAERRAVETPRNPLILNDFRVSGWGLGGSRHGMPAYTLYPEIKIPYRGANIAG
jgi:hypothetical protein